MCAEIHKAFSLESLILVKCAYENISLKLQEQLQEIE